MTFPSPFGGLLVAFSWPFGDLLVTFQWPFNDILLTFQGLVIDFLRTFWWPFDNLWWPCGDLSMTFWWLFDDFLMTFWWPFSDLSMTFGWPFGNLLMIFNDFWWLFFFLWFKWLCITTLCLIFSPSGGVALGRVCALHAKQACYIVTKTVISRKYENVRPHFGEGPLSSHVLDPIYTFCDSALHCLFKKVKLLLFVVFLTNGEWSHKSQECAWKAFKLEGSFIK